MSLVYDVDYTRRVYSAYLLFPLSRFVFSDPKASVHGTDVPGLVNV